MLEKVKEEVAKLHKDDKTGHDINHIENVLKLSLEFSKDYKDINLTLLTLISLLHDADDVKIFSTNDYANAKRIMKEAKVCNNLQKLVLSEISSIGFGKRLEGAVPKTVEGKIVSDADMCEALGIKGLLRINMYAKSRGDVFFDKDIYPVEFINKDNYRYSGKTSICHVFEKLLKLEYYMLTEEGYREATIRTDEIVRFLAEFFNEEKAYEWNKYLFSYLKKLNRTYKGYSRIKAK